MPLRVTTRTAPAGIKLAAEFSTASEVIRSSESRMRSTFMFLGDTHGMVPPSQKAGFALLGVPPPYQTPKSDRGAQTQDAGNAFFTPPAPHSTHPKSSPTLPQTPH